MKNKIQAPKAKKILKTIAAHNDARHDYYYWLNDATNPEVIDYLKKENIYCDHMMSHTNSFQATLFNEMKSRIKEDDESVPYKFNGYWYFVKYEVGKDYPIYIRRKESLSALDEILFDCNDMASGHAYFRLSGISVSPDNTKVAYGIDTLGRRQYTIYVKDLKTSKLLSKDIINTTGSSTWANDNKTIYYTANDTITLRSNKIYKHFLGTTGEDTLVYNELDETFNTTVYKTKSQQFIVIASYSSLSNEFQILNADQPEDDFKIFQPRVKNLEYSIYHFDENFYVLTNCDGAVNFKLMSFVPKEI